MNDISCLLNKYEISTPHLTQPDGASGVENYRTYIPDSPILDLPSPVNLDISADGFRTVSDKESYSPCPAKVGKRIRVRINLGSVPIGRQSSGEDNGSGRQGKCVVLPSATVVRSESYTPTLMYSARTRANVKNALISDDISDDDDDITNFHPISDCKNVGYDDYADEKTPIASSVAVRYSNGGHAYAARFQAQGHLPADTSRICAHNKASSVVYPKTHVVVRAPGQGKGKQGCVDGQISANAADSSTTSTDAVLCNAFHSTKYLRVSVGNKKDKSQSRSVAEPGVGKRWGGGRGSKSKSKKQFYCYDSTGHKVRCRVTPQSPVETNALPSIGKRHVTVRQKSVKITCNYGIAESDDSVRDGSVSCGTLPAVAAAGTRIEYFSRNKIRQRKKSKPVRKFRSSDMRKGRKGVQMMPYPKKGDVFPGLEHHCTSSQDCDASAHSRRNSAESRRIYIRKTNQLSNDLMSPPRLVV